MAQIFDPFLTPESIENLLANLGCIWEVFILIFRARGVLYLSKIMIGSHLSIFCPQELRFFSLKHHSRSLTL